MRYFSILFVLSLFACTSSKSSSIPKDIEAKIQKQFDKNITLIKAKNYEKLAPFITYGGQDEERYCKDVCNYEVAGDQRMVDDLIEETIKHLGTSLEYTYDSYFFAKESEGTWHVLVAKTAESKKVGFAFLKIGDLYTFADITTDVK
ncbi:MAG: hypothetical protein GY810_29810 [Aureispira sp.]|nr:hypothetical protein [Aureispira sp.]